MKMSILDGPRSGIALAAASMLATAAAAAGPAQGHFEWQTVVNNGDTVPPADAKKFNSYNQPSVNKNGLVVFRARSTGGSQGRESGIYTRQMTGGDANPIEMIANLKTVVPEPNDVLYPTPGGGGAKLGTFIEFPSIPRIAAGSNALATRGNHRPVLETGDERVGTTGVYVKLDGNVAESPLLTGASKLGAAPGLSYFAVPGAGKGTFFDVFPGSPAITDDGTIAFKGNYTEEGVAKTGVYYRALAKPGDTYGTSPVRLIANSDTEIPYLPRGISKRFGSFDSTSPPSAAGSASEGGSAVFVGLDNEDDPSYGGIYEAQLDPKEEETAKASRLTLLVGLGTRVPGITGPSFTRLGEGLSWDGRYLAFWGAWGKATKTVRLYCPTEGNKLRRAFCESEASGSIQDPATGKWYQEKQVPMNQGIFVHDAETGENRIVARTNSEFDDFVFWNFSGRVEGMEEGDDGEPARWRSAAFVAVSDGSVAFKARSGAIDRVTHAYEEPVDGIYLQRRAEAPLEMVADTTMYGKTLDGDERAAKLPITELGLERDGFRGGKLVINARMGVEEGAEGASWAGIYLTDVTAH